MSASVRENLIAARALIDTPEKWNSMGQSWSRAIYTATNGWAGFFEAETAYSAQRTRAGSGHQAVLNRFDRAIAAQEPTP